MTSLGSGFGLMEVRFIDPVVGISKNAGIEASGDGALEKIKKALTVRQFRFTVSATDTSVKMANSNSDPQSQLPLTPAVFHVLLALAGGELHGYAIMQEVALHTEGQIKMGPGTLYGTVKRLLEARLIEESEERPDPQMDDERRRYYRLTGVGEEVVRAEAQRYAQMVELARGKKLIPKPA